MKKISSIALALIVVLSLTGCGGKTVTCTKTEDETTSEIKATFNGKEVTKIVMESKTEVEADEVDTSYSLLKMVEAMFEGKTGIKISTTKGTNSVSMKVEMEPSKLDEEVIDSMDLGETDFKNTSAEEYTKTMTEDGYTCK